MIRFRDALYRVRYALRIYRRSTLSLAEAWRYPVPVKGCWTRTDDPVGDADSEMSYWGEG